MRIRFISWPKIGAYGGREANVAALPFKKSFAEVLRVMAPGATFCIVNEDDGLSGNNDKWEKIIEGMHTYTPDEVKAHLTAAGFKNIDVRRDETRHWLMVTAKKQNRNKGIES